MVEGAVPEPAESFNQLWSLTPVKVSVPDPEFVMLKLEGERVALPTCPAKLRLPGLTLSAGARGVTVTTAVALLLESARLVAITFT